MADVAVGNSVEKAPRRGSWRSPFIALAALVTAAGVGALTYRALEQSDSSSTMVENQNENVGRLKTGELPERNSWGSTRPNSEYRQYNLPEGWTHEIHEDGTEWDCDTDGLCSERLPAPRN